MKTVWRIAADFMQIDSEQLTGFRFAKLIYFDFTSQLVLPVQYTREVEIARMFQQVRG